MLLVVDNGSIFTKNLIDFLSQKDISFQTQTPYSLDLKNLENYDSFILSGRRKNEKKINEINSKVVRYSIENNTNLLGICYGAEILALTAGGTIKKMLALQKGNEIIEIQKENLLVGGKINVFESHSFEISKLPETIIPLGRSSNCKYEIIQYQNTSIYGTQFHPEMSNDGQKLIETFCNL